MKEGWKYKTLNEVGKTATGSTPSKPKPVTTSPNPKTMKNDMQLQQSDVPAASAMNRVFTDKKGQKVPVPVCPVEDIKRE